MTEHFIVTLDRGHLRIYAEERAPGQATPRLALVEAMDFPAGTESYTAHETDQAGRFPGALGRQGGGSIDERLPMRREVEKRRIEDLAGEVNSFLRTRPEASWDLAAPAEIQPLVLAQLAPSTRERLRRSLAKDLTNQPVAEVRAHFAAAGAR